MAKKNNKYFQIRYKENFLSSKMNKFANNTLNDNCNDFDNEASNLENIHKNDKMDIFQKSSSYISILNRNEEPTKYEDSNSDSKAKVFLYPTNENVLREVVKESKINGSHTLVILIPNFIIQIPNKNIFELLYNRLALDLLLWEPKYIPIPNVTPMPESDFGQSQSLNNQHDTIIFTLNAKINRVSAIIRTPYYLTGGHISTLYNGEVVLDLINSEIFLSVGKIKTVDVTKFTIFSEYAEVFHNEKVPSSKIQTLEKDFMPIINNTHSKLIKKVEVPFYEKVSKYDKKRMSIYIALQMEFHEITNVQKTKISLEFRNLQYLLDNFYHSNFWINQLVDMFTIEYFPINGYDLPQSVIEVTLKLTKDLIVTKSDLNVSRAIILFNDLNFRTCVTDSGSNLYEVQLNCTELFISKNTEEKLCRENWACIFQTYFLEGNFADFNDQGEADCKNKLFLGIRGANIHLCYDSFHEIINVIEHIKSQLNEPELVEDSQKSVAEIDTNSDYSIQFPDKNHLCAKPYISFNEADIISSKEREIICEQVADAANDTFCEKEFEQCSILSDFSPCVSYTNQKPMVQIIDKSSKNRKFSSEGLNSNFDKLKTINLLEDAMNECENSEDEFIILDVSKSYKKPEDVYVYSEITDEHWFVLNKYVPLAKNKTIKNEKLKFKIDLDISGDIYIYGGNDFNCVAPCSEIKPETPFVRQTNNSHKSSYLFNGYRSKNECVMFSFKDLKLSVKSYPETSELYSHLCLKMQSFEIIDKLESSKVDRLLHGQVNIENDKGQPFLRLVVHTYCKKNQITMEQMIKLSLSPTITLNIDQGTLLFLCRCIINFSNPYSSKTEYDDSCNLIQPKLVIPGSKSADDLPDRNKMSELDTFISEFHSDTMVKLVFNYDGRGIDSDQFGIIAGFFLMVSELNRAHVMIPEIKVSGVMGYEALLLKVIDKINDYRAGHMFNFICGVPAVQPFAKFLSGVKEFIVMPIEHYKGNKGIATGFETGSKALCKSSITALLDMSMLSCNFIKMITDKILISMDLPRDKSNLFTGGNQPLDATTGFNCATTVLRQNINATSNQLAHYTANDRYTNRRPSQSIKDGLSFFPKMIFSSISSVGEAGGLFFGGIKNHLQSPTENAELKLRFRKDEEEKKKYNRKSGH